MVRLSQNPASKVSIDPVPELPHDDAAEVAVLSSILLDDRTLSLAASILQPEDFYRPHHSLIFRHMLGVRNGIDPNTIAQAMSDEDPTDLERIGGIAYLSEIARDVSMPAHAEHYARRIKNKSILREIARQSLELQEATLRVGCEPSDLGHLFRRMEAVLAPAAVRDEFALTPDLPMECLDGRLGEICLKRLPHSPRAYSWPALLTVAGTLCPPSGARTNLYGALVGAVGTGKTQTIESAIRTMGVIPPILEETMAGSAEGLFAKLEGANGEARLLSVDELAHLLAKAKIDNASFPFVLNRGYYATQFDLTIAHGKKIHVNCSLSAIGGIVEDNFQNSFGTSTTGGLHDRFIFGQCPRPFEFSYRPFEGGAERTEPCPVSVNADVWEARDSWLTEIPGLTGRHAEHAIRAAVIAASFSGRLILRARDLGPARVFAEYQSRVRKLLQPNPGENTDARCAFAIMQALAQCQGWISKRELARKIHAHRSFGPSAFERAIKSLVFSGEIELTEKRPVRVRLVPR